MQECYGLRTLEGRRRAGRLDLFSFSLDDALGKVESSSRATRSLNW